MGSFFSREGAKARRRQRQGRMASCRAAARHDTTPAIGGQGSSGAVGLLAFAGVFFVLSPPGGSGMARGCLPGAFVASRAFITALVWAVGAVGALFWRAF